MSCKFILVTLFVMGGDQISKSLAHQVGMVQFNSGISFGILDELSSVAVMVFTFLALLSFILVFRTKISAMPIATGLLLGGGISNLLDRVQYGAVRDWLPVPFFALRNNLADWCIMIGLLVILIKEIHAKHSNSA